MTDIAIRVENLSKLYRIGGPQARYKTLRDTVMDVAAAPIQRLRRLGQPTPPEETIWALKDVSFEVKQGEVLGIIGRNGSGKTTLLKVLSRITEPTEGQAEIHGRVGSLLEVGTGFHPELTGRENIYLNGAILGMKRTEIDGKFDEIVDFAEIEKFLDTPVKRYSSGMYVRLAFAVAAHLEPEILLVDEVLAVGDAAFQKKCLGKMGDVARQGRTVLFVSHNMAAVRHLCEKAIWIDEGGVLSLGGTDFVVNQYLTTNQLGGSEFLAKPRDWALGGKRVTLLRVSVKNNKGEVVDIVANNAPFVLELEYEIKGRLENLRFGYRLAASDGTVVLTSGDTDPEGGGVSREPGTYVSKCTVPGNLLNAGGYNVTVACDKPMQEILFWHENIVSFAVQLAGGAGASVPDGRLGVVRPTFEWDVSCLSHEGIANAQ